MAETVMRVTSARELHSNNSPAVLQEQSNDIPLPLLCFNCTCLVKSFEIPQGHLCYHDISTTVVNTITSILTEIDKKPEIVITFVYRMVNLQC